MRSSNFTDEQLIEFFLGGLSEQERTEIEDRFFSDDGFYEELLALEDELIGDYVRGLLAPALAARCERIYSATPEKRERVELARELANVISEEPREAEQVNEAPPRSISRLWLLRRLIAPPRLAIALAAALVLLSGVWLVRNTLKLRAEIRALQKAQSNLTQSESELQKLLQSENSKVAQLSTTLDQVRIQRDNLEKHLAQLKGAASAVLSLALSPGLGRGIDDAPRVTILPATRTIRLILSLPRDIDFQHYHAVLQSIEGDVKVELKDLRKAAGAHGGNVIASFPTSTVRNGDYRLTLSGAGPSGQTQEIADYSFRVIR